MSAWTRGVNAGKALFDVVGRLWAAGYPIDLALVNEYTGVERCIVDLPNYSWDHSTKYWHENDASKDWRFRRYIVHDLLGSKILGTSWHAPAWRSHLNVSNVPFLMDHQIGGKAIMPGAGFITMALEALYQKHCALLAADRKDSNILSNDLCYHFRDIRFSKALVLEEGNDITIVTTLTAASGRRDWHDFRISTTDGEFTSDHCSGSIRIQDPISPAEGDDFSPLESPQPNMAWYKWLREIGLDFGPAFRRLVEIESIVGSRSSKALISLEPLEGKYVPQSYYPIHPAALDGCLQAAFPAMTYGDRTTSSSPLVPALIDDFIINKVPSRLQQGRSRATSVYSGRGRVDQLKNWHANVSVRDAESDTILVQITGMHYAELDVPPKPDLHTFHSVIWKPDISFLVQDPAASFPSRNGLDKIDTILDLVAHKKPSLKIMELNFGEADTSCVWFEGGTPAARFAYSEYVFGSTNVQSLGHVETLYTHKGSTSFHHFSLESLAQRQQPFDVLYDLVIVKIGTTTANRSLATETLKSLLSTEAYMVVLDNDEMRPTYPTNHDASSGSMNGMEFKGVEIYMGALLSSSVIGGPEKRLQDMSTLWAMPQIQTSERTETEPAMDSSPITARSGEDTPASSVSECVQELIIASLSPVYRETDLHVLESVLHSSGWNVTYKEYPFSKPATSAVILILDELWEPLLATVNNEQWEAIKTLVSWGIPLLWVTEGAQGVVTNPDSAMVHGLFRVARQEDPNAKLVTLDVHSRENPATGWAIEKVLGLLKRDDPVETEYMERGGVLSIQRVMPDDTLNRFRRAEDEGFEPIVKELHGNAVQVKLIAERLGTFEALTWFETETKEVSKIGINQVEVEVMAVGVNFKDVAIIMGIVPDDEYNLGVECAGVVRRLGPGAEKKFSIGDRLCMLVFGTYSNRVRAPVDRCHIIPASMTFEEAATIPSVYLCSLYAMYHLGGLREGQSVLIHSAAGGVGIACIELALHRKAQIFVTVGTDEKRQFLASKYGIPQSRIFSSRTTAFAGQIMKSTGGHGVNVIVNSLTGELLDASWRIMADGGTMVEIGKKDILDRNTLAMEPFNRNCSFRAIDMSYSRHVDGELIASLFDELFDLIDAGHIKPIHPITTFGFDEVADALSHIRSGRHLGKIVVSNKGLQDIQIPIRPAIHKLQLRPDVSYLVVGGLRGACGTLVVHLAQHGARKILVNSRSGIRDEVSAMIVASCRMYDCEVSEAQGDIGDITFVRHLFETATPPVAGIIQGAMVLRDKPLESMTLDDYHTAVYAKVQGSKNLHQVSEEMRKAGRNQPLDFFTMLSSTSGIIGNKGQANYAAANTFLDAFASYRRSLGLCANTVDLGVIEDVGYLAGSTIQSRFDTHLWTPISARMLRKILTYSILRQDHEAQSKLGSGAQMITGIAYPLPIHGLESASDPRFAYLFNSRAGDNSNLNQHQDVDKGDKAAQAIQQFRLLQKSGADTVSLTAAIVEVVTLQMVKYLRLDFVPEAERPLMAYGLDSLSAVELRNWIRGKLGVELATLDITGAKSLRALFLGSDEASENFSFEPAKLLYGILIECSFQEQFPPYVEGDGFFIRLPNWFRRFKEKMKRLCLILEVPSVEFLDVIRTGRQQCGLDNDLPWANPSEKTAPLSPARILTATSNRPSHLAYLVGGKYLIMAAHNSLQGSTRVAGNRVYAEQPPSYNESFTMPAATSSLGFPLTMKAYGDPTVDGTFYLCGDSKENRLYAVTVKGTRGEMALLGASPGLILRSGPKNDDPIIAAAGEELKSQDKYIKNGSNSSIILVLDARNAADSKMTTLLRSKLSDSGEIAAFTYFLNNPTGSDTRYHQFSWLKVKNGEPGFEHGGWKLQRVSLEERLNQPSGSAVLPRYGSPLMDDGQTLAQLIYAKPVTLGHREEITLKFTDHAVRLNIGGHWACAAVITAAGLNVGYVTYAMLSMVDHDYEKLLDSEALMRTAQRTFSVMYQHFANNNLSVTNGGYAYQSPNEKLSEDIGTKINITKRATGPNKPAANSSMVVARLTTGGALIHVYICVVDICIASRNYNRMVVRPLNSLADVSVLVARSDRLLELVRYRSVSSIKKDDGIRAELAWLRNAAGERRWDIELVDME
ncbi:hypothetical protein O1611_g2342 [Lasiodiplodia mahajangana]|uniref:Uncharacterized protein n=1 Tax=Lasiodiplodia mahajangana TaxID=1108764 RepID=A0ACC2JUW3_9PEZI|nr:hypothetical protein O1611_g2342 [Lasiodiplodia mahajangana]